MQTRVKTKLILAVPSAADNLYNKMFRLIKDVIFAWQYKRAVRKAVELSKLHGMKFYVVYLNGGLKVVPKKAVKELVARRRFRKGVTVQDIEKRALFVTH